MVCPENIVIARIIAIARIAIAKLDCITRPDIPDVYGRLVLYMYVHTVVYIHPSPSSLSSLVQRGRREEGAHAAHTGIHQYPFCLVVNCETYFKHVNALDLFNVFF